MKILSPEYWRRPFQDRDLRLRILKHYSGLNKSTSEEIANEWLATQHEDLGTIRRALIDLIKNEYLEISEISNNDPVEWLNENWSTSGLGGSPEQNLPRKSSQRLVENVTTQAGHGKVKSLKLFVTIKGLLFYKEYVRFKQKYWIQVGFIILASLIGGFIGSFFRAG